LIPRFWASWRCAARADGTCVHLAGQHRADAWHRGQQVIEPSESSIGGDHLGQAPLDEADIGFKSCQSAFAEPPEHGIFEMSRLVLDGDMLVTQLSPHGHDLCEPSTRVGMMATYSAISRASRRSFLAKTPRARAN
jgi:hypothetical protein